MKSFKIIHLTIIILLIFVFFEINVSAIQTNTMLNDIHQIKSLRLGGTDKFEKNFPVTANVIGSPQTSKAPGSTSIGLGYSYVTFDNSFSSQKNIGLNSILVSITSGLTNRTDISLSMPYTKTNISDDENLDGIGDLSINLNHSYIEQEDFGFSLGFGFAASPLFGSQGIDSNDKKTDLTGTFKLEKKINNSKININFSFTYQDMGRSNDNEIFGLGLSFSHGFNKKFSASLELLTSDAKDEKGNYTSILFLGTRYILNLKSSVSLIAGRNFENSILENIVVTNYSYRF